jgi:L-lactate dehydrogenase complex protein LldG
MAEAKGVSTDRQRRTVLTQVNDALGGQVEQRRVAATAWLERTRVAVLPKAAPLAPHEELPHFIDRATAAAAIVTIAKMSDIPRQISATIADWKIVRGIVAASDPLLRSWLGESPQASLRFGCPVPSDQVSVALAAAAIAETGTLVFVSGPSSPAALAFLPEYLIAIVPASRLVASYNAVLPMLLKCGSPLAMPRCVHFVTGPSRTADIEEVLLIGAHGPRAVKMLVVDDA